MSFLDKLERRFGFLAFHNLTLYLIIGQIAMFGLMVLNPGDSEVLGSLVFSWERFLSGEVWRLATFILIPPDSHPIFIIFAWMVFYMMGTFLESHWGAFRYNLYVFAGVAGAVLSGLVYPAYPIFNYYLGLSITFAFAYLNPNFELRIFFVLPVKMKWIAAFIGGMLLLGFFGSPGFVKIMIVGSLINFPIFFGKDILMGLRSKQRVRTMKAEKRKLDAEPFHVCSVCAATDLSHPERTFRYRKDGALCSECSEPIVTDDG